MVAFIQVSEEQLDRAPPAVRAYLTQLRSTIDGDVNAEVSPPSSQPSSIKHEASDDEESHDIDKTKDGIGAEEVAEPVMAPHAPVSRATSRAASRATTRAASRAASTPEDRLDELNDSLKRIHSLLAHRQPSWPRVAPENATAVVVGSLHVIQGHSAAVSAASVSGSDVSESHAHEHPSNTNKVDQSATALPVRSRTGLTDDETYLLAHAWHHSDEEDAQQQDITNNNKDQDADTPASSPKQDTDTGTPPPAIHIQETPMPPVRAPVRPVALPDFTGTDSAVLEELIQFGTKHWPEKNLSQFRPGCAIGWPMFNELVQQLVFFDLHAYNYTYGTSPRNIRGQPHAYRGIIWPHYITNEHFAIAVIDLQKHAFTSWGMGNHMHGEGKAGYENSLGYALMGFKYQLPSCADNMSAFRCIEAVYEFCTGFPSQVADSTSVRLAFLKRLLQRLVDANKRNASAPIAIPAGRDINDGRHQRNSSLTHRRPSVTSRASHTTRTSETSLSSSHKRHAEEDANHVDVGEPPFKKKDVAPPTDLLVRELTNSNAIDRMRAHLRNYKSDSRELQWDKQKNWADQTSDILNIADGLDVKQNVTRKVVSMILRTHALRILYRKARIMQEIDEGARDPPLPTSILDEVYPQVRQKRSAAASRRWLTLTRKLEKLGDYLPFIPHGTGTPVTFREYERLSNENLQALLTHLANDPVGRRIARAGRAFRNHVLYRSNQTYAWETMSNDELQKLSDNDLLQLIPKKTRRSAVHNDFDDSDADSYYDEEEGEDNEDDDIEQVVRQSMPGTVPAAAAGHGQPMMFNVSLLHPAASSSAGASEDWDVVSSGASSHASRRYSSAQNQYDAGVGSSSNMALATATTNQYTQHHQRHYSQNQYQSSHSPYLDVAQGTATDFGMDWVGLPPAGDDDFTTDYPDYPAFLEDPTFQEMAAPLPHLSVFIKMPDSHEAITFALKGNIDGLAKLFAEGRVSPMHVSDTRGFTLMRWALYGGMHNYKTVQFLLQNGAPVDDESYANAWDFQLRNKCSPEEKLALRCVTDYKNRDWIDEQAFPAIHQIIFGMSRVRLEDYLRDHPASVHDVDTLQRTALDWAVARKQLADIHTLIRYKASVETMDTQGRTALHHAVDSHSLETLRIVLAAGADPNRQLPSHFHRSSALTSASLAHKYAPGMVRLLVQHGAHIHAANPEGQTALERAALSDNVECAQVLVDNGADMFHVSGTGITPIQAAVKHHSHSVLSYFIAKNGGYGPDNLIEYVLKYGDATTQKIYFPYV